MVAKWYSGKGSTQLLYQPKCRWIFWWMVTSVSSTSGVQDSRSCHALCNVRTAKEFELHPYADDQVLTTFRVWCHLLAGNSVSALNSPLWLGSIYFSLMCWKLLQFLRGLAWLVYQVVWWQRDLSPKHCHHSWVLSLSWFQSNAFVLKWHFFLEHVLFVSLDMGLFLWMIKFRFGDLTAFSSMFLSHISEANPFWFWGNHTPLCVQRVFASACFLGSEMSFWKNTDILGPRRSLVSSYQLAWERKSTFIKDKIILPCKYLSLSLFCL